MMKEKATVSPTISLWKQNIKEIIHPLPQKGMPQETYAKFHLNDPWFEPPSPENDPDSPMPNGFFTARTWPKKRYTMPYKTPCL